MGYWSLVDPVWNAISIYDGPETFLQQYAKSPEASRALLCAHWCQSEICNGGFGQFFSNSTGVLAPEAAEAFRKIGMPQTAELVEQAMALLGGKYLRDREERAVVLDALWETAPDQAHGPFNDHDDLFFTLIAAENGGFDAAADAYAALNGAGNCSRGLVA